jgi:dTDP-D-glucose 4,6-dehydratase
MKSSLKHLHLILPTIYGENEAQHRLLPYLINAIQLKKNIQLTSGNQVREYLYINDFITYLFCILKNNSILGIYNIPSAEQLTVRDVVKKVFSFYGMDLQESIFGSVMREDQDMKILKLNTSRLVALCEPDHLLKIDQIIPLYHS